MFNRINFGTRGRLKDQTNILWKMQLLRTMPTRSINLHDDEAISKLLRNMLQKDLHHFSIGSRQDEGSHFPRLRSNSSKGIESLTNDLMRGTRPHACWCPASSGWVMRPKRASS